MNQHKLIRVEQCPEQILQNLKTVRKRARGYCRACVTSLLFGMPAQGGKVNRIDHECFG